MKFKIMVKIDNDIFLPFQGVELARILRKLATRLDCGEEYDKKDTGKIYDDNGNLVGSWEFTA